MSSDGSDQTNMITSDNPTININTSVNINSSHLGTTSTIRISTWWSGVLIHLDPALPHRVLPPPRRDHPPHLPCCPAPWQVRPLHHDPRYVQVGPFRWWWPNIISKSFLCSYFFSYDTQWFMGPVYLFFIQKILDTFSSLDTKLRVCWWNCWQS